MLKNKPLVQAVHFSGTETYWSEIAADPVTFKGANITSAAAHNRKIVLHTIRSRGVISRKGIAHITCLTPPAIFKIANELLHEGLVTTSRSNEKLKGKPTHSLRINPDAAFAFGLNIDRNHLTFVVVDFLGVVRHRFRSTIPFAGPDDVRSFVSGCINGLKQRGLFPLNNLTGLGVAIPDDLGSTILPGQPDRYREWNDIQLGELFHGILDIPIIRENDAAAAAIGEMSLGHGLELDSFFYVFISAGLGGGLVINRRYVRGAHGRSGEIGFLPQVNPLRNSQTNLQRTLGDAALTSSLLTDLREAGFVVASLEDIDKLNDAKVVVDRWVRQIADYLYLPLLTIMAAVDPNAILVGGDLPHSITNALSFELSKRLSMHVGMAWPHMAVRSAAVRDDPTAVGSAVLAFQSLWEAVPNDRAEIAEVPRRRSGLGV